MKDLSEFILLLKFKTSFSFLPIATFFFFLKKDLGRAPKVAIHDKTHWTSLVLFFVIHFFVIFVFIKRHKMGLG